MSLEEKCKSLKKIAFENGWDSGFYDFHEEELFDRAYPSLVKKIIEQIPFCMAVFGGHWELRRLNMLSFPTVEERLEYMYKHRI